MLFRKLVTKTRSSILLSSIKQINLESTFLFPQIPITFITHLPTTLVGQAELGIVLASYKVIPEYFCSVRTETEVVCGKIIK